MGTVYEATQLSLNRPVALKLIAPALGDDAVFRERFRREGVSQATLDHPHIVPIFEAGESEYGLFLAMRLIRGSTLKDRVAAGELDRGRALGILRQIADALDAAHGAGLVHRDVKSHNVLIEEDDAYLADFGLTKMAGEGGLTASGHQVGSLEYISPEQIRGEPVTSKSDLYAFGIVAYETLAGHVPYSHDSDAALMYAHLEDTPPPTGDPSTPTELDRVLRRALAKQPDERFETASAFIDAVGAALASAPETLLSAEPARPSRRSQTVVDAPVQRPVTPVPMSVPPKSRRGIVGALAAAGLAVAAAVVAAAVGQAHATDKVVQLRRVDVGRGSIAVPVGWRRIAPIVLPGFEVPNERVSLSAGGGAGIVVVQADASDAMLLPASLVKLLRERPKAKAVEIGGMQAYHYEQLRAKNRVYVVDALALAGGRSLLVVCYAPAGGEVAPECSGVAASLRLGEAALTLAPSRHYASVLAAAVQKLDRVRAAQLNALKTAKKSSAQATAARSIAAAYAAAASSVPRVEPRARERTVFLKVAVAFRTGEDAWNHLAAAAAAESTSGYVAAQAEIQRADSAVAAAIATLKPYGYEPT